MTRDYVIVRRWRTADPPASESDVVDVYTDRRDVPGAAGPRGRDPAAQLPADAPDQRAPVLRIGRRDLLLAGGRAPMTRRQVPLATLKIRKPARKRQAYVERTRQTSRAAQKLWDTRDAITRASGNCNNRASHSGGKCRGV
jgi:hypothetical protein